MDAVTLAAANAAGAKKFQRLRPTAWLAASTHADGTPATMDSGQAITSFGNAPLSITSGTMVHTPIVSANSSGYWQVDAGSSIVAVAAEVAYPAGSTGNVALVIPASSWYVNGTVVLSSVQAGVHFVMYGNGQWHVSNWNGTAEQIYTSGQIASMLDGVTRRVELHIDRATNTLAIYLPDGTTVTYTDSRITANTSTLAICELYESNAGGGAVAATIKSWSALGTADVINPRHPTATKGDIARAVNKPLPQVSMVTYAPATDPAVTVPTSAAAASAGNAQITFAVPQSGKVRLSCTSYLTMSAAAQIIWSFRDSGNTTIAPVQTVVNGQFTGNVHAEWLLQSLTPGISYTILLYHFSTVANAAVWHASSGSGYYFNVSADPVK